MGQAIERLIQEALALPTDSRALLADKLVESLQSSAESAVQKQWLAEALRRRDEVRSGAVQTVSGQEALAQVRRLIGL